MDLLKEAQKIVDGEYNEDLNKWIDDNKGIEFVVTTDGEYSCIYPEQLVTINSEYNEITVIDIISINTNCDRCKWDNKCNN
jgi:hypothetical protein